MNRKQSGGSRQIVSELESLLTQYVEPSPAEIKAAHGRAMEAIRAVNERIVSAHGLITAGRRAEAIEIAEGPPHVFDEIAILDSQLVRDWEHWSGHFGLPRFPPVRSDLAAFLNNAYTTEKQNEHLLRRHQLLAIGRANLRPRIATLAQLAASDPSNPHWSIALAEYQRHRLEQLAERATQARKLKDLRCLQQVMSELRQTRWLTPVLGAQVDSVKKQINQLQNRESTNEAIALAEHIQDAHASGARERLQSLINRWRQIEPHVDKKAMAERLPHVRHAIDWYDQDQLRQRRAEAQDKALNRIGKIKPNAQPEEIQSVIQEITLTGAEVPAELRETYRERLDQEKRAKRFKNSAIAAAIMLVVFGVILLAMIAYRGHQRERSLTQTIDTIDNMYRENDLVAVERLLETVPADDSRFDQFRKRLSERKLAEELRATRFQEDAVALSNALAEAKEEEEFDALTPRINRLASRAEKEEEIVSAREILNSSKKRRQQRKEDFIQITKELSARIRADLRTLPADDAARPTLTQWNLQLRQRRTNRWVRGESDLLKHLDETSNAVADRWDSIRELGQKNIQPD